ncbi:hypothetical protein Tco_0161813, partial [Tanacetum coccineum]
PISLIGCLYKIIAKILAMRLKSVISLVISEVQTAYVEGIPVGAFMSRSVHWQPIIDQFSDKLSSWKAKNVSYGVLLSSEFGELNIGSLKGLNWSLLVKWWWHFKTKKNSLWKKVVCSFHGSDGNLGVASDVGSRGGVWGKIASIGNGLEKIDTWRRPIKSGREESEFNDLQHEISSIILSSNKDSWRWSLHLSGLDVIPLDTALNVLEMADDGDLNLGEKISSLFDVVVLCAIW